MKKNLDTLKGIHPGRIIGRDLRKRNLSQRAFAASINEHSQTLNAVIAGRRNLTTPMAVKIERAIGYEEGFLLTLQAFFEISEFKRQELSASVSGIPAVRRMLFWDTDFDKIDWGISRSTVIERILERGNESEKCEIARFYGLRREDLDNYRSKNQYRLRSKKIDYEN